MSFSIRTRLLFGYVCLLTIILIVGSIGLYSRYILTDRLERMGERATRIEQMHRLTLAIDRLLMPANDYLVSGDKKAELERYRMRLDEMNEILARIDMYDWDEKFLNELQTRLSEVRAKADEIFSLAPPEASVGAALMHSMDKSGDDAYSLLHDKALLHKQELKDILEDTSWTLSFVNRSMVAGAISVIILSMVLVFYLERSIRVPIERLSEGVKGLGSGRWNKVDIKGGAEVTSLANEFNNMVERLRTTYDDLVSKVKEVEDRTAQLNELNKKLETLSITDGLTGLFNHRHFYERLAEEIERAKRYGSAFSLLMIDIDHFKYYNDKNGHMAGDVVLKGIAECLRSGARDVDLVFRYGGEEFAVIAQEREKKGGLAFAERMRKIVESYTFPNQETQPGGNITISLGVALYPDDTERLERLVLLADEALYRAKQMGRNRVEQAKG
jgi:diguanylate cyclase (GGDEF)-like protein